MRESVCLNNLSSKTTADVSNSSAHLEFLLFSFILQSENSTKCYVYDTFSLNFKFDLLEKKKQIYIDQLDASNIKNWER